jgi:hypothetical protein
MNTNEIVRFHRTGRRWESSCPRCGRVLVSVDEPALALCDCGLVAKAEAA